MEKIYIISTTFENKAGAEHLAGLLLEKRLIACAQISPPITSLYRWEGEVAKEAEVQLSVKTTEIRVEEVKELIIQTHPYELPEIIVLPVESSTEAYTNWVYKEVK